MAAILSYVPVMQPITPIIIINIFFIILKADLSDVVISNSGGIRSAKAVLLMAPIKEMKRFKYGMASAKTTEKNA